MNIGLVLYHGFAYFLFGFLFASLAVLFIVDLKVD